VDHQPTEQDGRRALRDHVLDRAWLARRRHGPVIDHAAMLRILDDREIVRYPVGLRFDSSELRAGEFAHAFQLSEQARGGFCLFVHPVFEARHDLLPLLIAYHLPAINYGDVAESEDCEAFGAALLGMDADEYYLRLCAAADSLK